MSNEPESDFENFFILSLGAKIISQDCNVKSPKSDFVNVHLPPRLVKIPSRSKIWISFSMKIFHHDAFFTTFSTVAVECKRKRVNFAK